MFFKRKTNDTLTPTVNAVIGKYIAKPKIRKA
jgi:hypothetical protein